MLLERTWNGVHVLTSQDLDRLLLVRRDGALLELLQSVDRLDGSFGTEQSAHLLNGGRLKGPGPSS
jgi:hypothetical protein